VLTPQREKYARALYKGLSQRKAYREAYPRSRSWKDATVDKRASELYQNREILGRLQELREKEEKAIQDKKLWSIEESARGLMWIMKQSQQDILDNGVRNANSKAFIDSLKELNDLLGLGAERQTKVELDKARIDKLKAEINITEEDTQEGRVADLLKGVIDVYKETE